jgi:hypothetical protein
MLDTVAVNVVVGPNRLLELVADDHAWSLCRSTAREQHDARAGVGERRLRKTVSVPSQQRASPPVTATYLEQADRDAERDAGASERALVARDRPRIARERLEDTRQLELALLHGQQKACGAKRLRRHRLARARRSAVLGGQSEHLLDLLRLVLLAATEDVGLAALGVTQLVYLRLRGGGQRAREAVATTRKRTMVPNVISPTSAYGGSRLRLTTSASRSALRSSSSMHVSTTKRKMGGTCAGRLSVYSMVVYFGRSSAGRFVLEISR